MPTGDRSAPAPKQAINEGECVFPDMGGRDAWFPHKFGKYRFLKWTVL